MANTRTLLRQMKKSPIKRRKVFQKNNSFLGKTLPNHSGDHSRGRVYTTPTTDYQIANKKYVDEKDSQFTIACGQRVSVTVNGDQYLRTAGNIQLSSTKGKTARKNGYIRGYDINLDITLYSVGANLQLVAEIEGTDYTLASLSGVSSDISSYGSFAKDAIPFNEGDTISIKLKSIANCDVELVVANVEGIYT